MIRWVSQTPGHPGQFATYVQKRGTQSLVGVSIGGVLVEVHHFTDRVCWKEEKGTEMPLQWTPRKGTWLPGVLPEYEEEREDLTIGTENGLSPPGSYFLCYRQRDLEIWVPKSGCKGSYFHMEILGSVINFLPYMGILGPRDLRSADTSMCLCLLSCRMTTSSRKSS